MKRSWERAIPTRLSSWTVSLASSSRKANWKRPDRGQGQKGDLPRGSSKGRRFFWRISKSGRVDPSMSPICASPKFRPNSLVELLGYEIHTCNVHQGWCQGFVLQFKTGESTLGADQPLAFSRNLKLWNLSEKLRKVQTPFKQTSSCQDTEESLGLVRQKRSARLVTSHRETQQHSDVNTNLAQFNKRLRFVSLQNKLAKAVCKTFLHDTDTSLSD